MKIPGVKARVNPIGIFGTANQTPIQLIVSGPNRDIVEKGANIIASTLKKIPGTADVRLSSEEGKPETRIEVDRAKMAELGVNVADVGAALRVALTGDDDSKFRDGDDDYDLRIALDKFDRSRISDVKNLSFMNNKGEMIELQQFADVYQTTGPTKLQRRNRINSVTVFSQAVGRPSGTIGQDIKAAIDKGILPAGVNVDYEGDLKNQADSFGSLGLAMMAAILFVYMVMIALYDSYLYPFVVLFSIPVAMVGAFLALALTMKSLSIFSILGIIMLVGLVGKNAILLVDRANQKRREDGLSAYEALIEAGKSRIRPILMTTTSMVIGMLPLAIAQDSGSEWKSGLAWAIIGGLISSMFLTLILVPVIYLRAELWKQNIAAFFRKIFGKKRVEAIELVPEVLQPEEN
jgi:HAE1 family hydrophobic/amphiphilic exporter-1